MKALRFTQGALLVADMPIPGDTGDALIRVTRSGICNTDVEIIRGYAGFEGTLGHEFVGVVERADDASHLIGKKVVGEINVGCGGCDRCASGDPRHCSARTVLGIHGRDGSHAEFLQLPAKNLLVVQKELADERAVFAEPLAAALGITEQVEIGSDSSVAVIGDGKLGLLCAISLALSSSDVTLIGKHPAKIRIAERSGVQGILLNKLQNSMMGKADVVVEASGSESGFATAVELVKPRGKIVLKSTFHGAPSWPAARIVVDEITIVGSRCGRMAPALELLESGAIDVEQLIDSEFSLSNAVEAVQHAQTSGVLKVLLKPA
jgi:threonine dehydrogenase-like Zn-dependent dehydrogenase